MQKGNDSDVLDTLLSAMAREQSITIRFSPEKLGELIRTADEYLEKHNINSKELEAIIGFAMFVFAQSASIPTQNT